MNKIGIEDLPRVTNTDVSAKTIEAARRERVEKARFECERWARIETAHDRIPIGADPYERAKLLIEDALDEHIGEKHTPEKRQETEFGFLYTCSCGGSFEVESRIVEKYGTTFTALEQVLVET